MKDEKDFKISKLEKLLSDQCESNKALKAKIKKLETKIKDLEYVLQGDFVRREKRAEKDHL